MNAESYRMSLVKEFLKDQIPINKERKNLHKDQVTRTLPDLQNP